MAQATDDFINVNVKKNLPVKTKIVPKRQVEVTAKPDESAESLLRRFNREVVRSGLMRRIKELEYYEKPSRKRRKEEALKKYRHEIQEQSEGYETSAE